MAERASLGNGSDVNPEIHRPLASGERKVAGWAGRLEAEEGHGEIARGSWSTKVSHHDGVIQIRSMGRSGERRCIVTVTGRVATGRFRITSWQEKR